MRSKLALENYFVLGNVARLQYQKNQIFSLYILKRLKKNYGKIRLYIVHVMLNGVIFQNISKNIKNWVIKIYGKRG